MKGFFPPDFGEPHLFLGRFPNFSKRKCLKFPSLNKTDVRPTPEEPSIPSCGEARVFFSGLTKIHAEMHLKTYEQRTKPITSAKGRG